MHTIKVLVVDDSPLVRKLLSEILDEDPMLSVVGTANDPYQARDKIKALEPDVITLDIEMPRMDGITFLRKIMKLRPMPVVMCSTLTEKNATVTLEALEIGAFDYVTKPTMDLSNNLPAYSDELRRMVKGAYYAWETNKRKGGAAPHAASGPESLQVAARQSADVIIPFIEPTSVVPGPRPLIAIGSSTGGTEALRQVFAELPAGLPGIVVAQHIPAAFSRPFAERLNNASAVEVCEAEDGMLIKEGHAYVAPGSAHLLVVKENGQYICRLNAGPRVNRHQPSVDVLFRSVLHTVGNKAVAAILTGMGDDGARGMKELRDGGAMTMAQDEKTSVVWGMPGEAVKLGGAMEVIPLGEVAAQLSRPFSAVSR